MEVEEREGGSGGRSLASPLSQVCTGGGSLSIVNCSCAERRYKYSLGDGFFDEEPVEMIFHGCFGVDP